MQARLPRHTHTAALASRETESSGSDPSTRGHSRNSECTCDAFRPAATTTRCRCAHDQLRCKLNPHRAASRAEFDRVTCAQFEVQCEALQRECLREVRADLRQSLSHVDRMHRARASSVVRCRNLVRLPTHHGRTRRVRRLQRDLGSLLSIAHVVQDGPTRMWRYRAEDYMRLPRSSRSFRRLSRAE